MLTVTVTGIVGEDRGPARGGHGGGEGGLRVWLGRRVFGGGDGAERDAASAVGDGGRGGVV